MVIKASGGLLRELATAAVESHRDTRQTQDAVGALAVDARQREANETDAANDKDAIARQVALGMTVAKAMQTTVGETRKAGEAANDIGASSKLEANTEAAAGGSGGAGGAEGAQGAGGADGAGAVGAVDGAVTAASNLDAVMNTRLGGEDANRVGDVFSRDQMKTLLSGEKMTMEKLKGTEPPFTEKQCKDILELQAKNPDGLLKPEQVSDFVWANRGRSETQAQGDQALKVSNAFITVISAGSDGMLKLGGEQRRRSAKAAGNEAQIGAQAADQLGQAATQDNQLRNDIAMHVINGRRGQGPA